MIMSWFKSLFGQRDPEMELNGGMPREPRVQMLVLHRISFQRLDPPPAEKIAVANLSTTGVGFIRNSVANWPAPGSKIRGEFTFDGKTYPAIARIVHISPMVVGC